MPPPTQQPPKDEVLEVFQNIGESKLYQLLLMNSLAKVAVCQNSNDNMLQRSPEIELLDNYERYLKLYRVQKNPSYFCIAKIFRRAAHRIYRVMRKQNLIEKNIKFLNIVK